MKQNLIELIGAIISFSYHFCFMKFIVTLYATVILHF